MFRKTNFYLTHPCPHLFWLDSGMVNAVAFHPPVFTFFSFVTKTLINIVTPQVSLREGYKNPSFGIRLLGRKGRNCSKKMRNKVKGKIAKKLTERGGPLNGLILLTQCTHSQPPSSRRRTEGHCACRWSSGFSQPQTEILFKEFHRSLQQIILTRVSFCSLSESPSLSWSICHKSKRRNQKAVMMKRYPDPRIVRRSDGPW